MQAELQHQLKQLRLTGMLETFEQRLLQTQEQGLSFCDGLMLMLSDEIARRERNRLKKRLKAARF